MDSAMEELSETPLVLGIRSALHFFPKKKDVYLGPLRRNSASSTPSRACFQFVLGHAKEEPCCCFCLWNFSAVFKAQLKIGGFPLWPTRFHLYVVDTVLLVAFGFWPSAGLGMGFQWTTSICEAIGNRSPRLGVICCPPVKGLKYLEIFRSTVGCMQQLVAAAQALLQTVTGKWRAESESEALHFPVKCHLWS